MAKKKSKQPEKTIRQFRHEVAVLKKYGMLPKSIDARSVKPTPWLKGQITRNKDVLTGKVRPVKVSKSFAKEAKIFDPAKVRNGRYLFELRPGEKVVVSHGKPHARGDVYYRTPLHVPPASIEEWLKWQRYRLMQDNNGKTKLPKGQYITFNYSNARKTPSQFHDIDKMLNFLQRYESIKNAQKGMGTQSDYEFINGLDFIVIDTKAK